MQHTFSREFTLPHIHAAVLIDLFEAGAEHVWGQTLLEHRLQKAAARAADHLAVDQVRDGVQDQVDAGVCSA